MRPLRAAVSRLALLSVTLWPVVSSAELAPPPPLQSGGLAPPPRESGPPPPAPGQPGPTQLALEASQEQDSGRGLEFVYFHLEGGFEFAGLDTLTKTGTLVPDGTSSSAVGPLDRKS